jgi:inorganic pyrophosphatase
VRAPDRPAAPGAGAPARAAASGMIHPWRDLPPGRTPPEVVTAVIEIPQGSRNKYELDKESGLFRLDRVLYSAVHYPGDYGLIPRTLHEDNDPLDVLVMIKEPTFTGCLVDVRPVGVLKMLDKGEPDDKILAVPCDDPQHGEYFDIADLPGHYLREIEHFFAIYKDLEGKRVEIVGWEKSEVAMRVIDESIARYAERYLSQGP